MEDGDQALFNIFRAPQLKTQLLKVPNAEGHINIIKQVHYGLSNSTMTAFVNLRTTTPWVQACSNPSPARQQLGVLLLDPKYGNPASTTNEKWIAYYVSSGSQMFAGLSGSSPLAHQFEFGPDPKDARRISQHTVLLRA